VQRDFKQKHLGKIGTKCKCSRTDAEMVKTFCLQYLCCTLLMKTLWLHYLYCALFCEHCRGNICVVH
jgi:hypothetical protein